MTPTAGLASARWRGGTVVWPAPAPERRRRAAQGGVRLGPCVAGDRQAVGGVAAASQAGRTRHRRPWRRWYSTSRPEAAAVAGELEVHGGPFVIGAPDAAGCRGIGVVREAGEGSEAKVKGTDPARRPPRPAVPTSSAASRPCRRATACTIASPSPPAFDLARLAALKRSNMRSRRSLGCPARRRRPPPASRRPAAATSASTAAAVLHRCRAGCAWRCAASAPPPAPAQGAGKDGAGRGPAARRPANACAPRPPGPAAIGAAAAPGSARQREQLFDQVVARSTPARSRAMAHCVLLGPAGVPRSRPICSFSAVSGVRSSCAASATNCRCASKAAPGPRAGR